MTDGMVVDELYRSSNLLVRRVARDGGNDVCVVTFDSFTDERRLDRPGFGEDFLRARGIDAIHVITRENDWYQYPETLDAMAAVHDATRRYRRVTTYGSSMGGYAAIRLAGVAGAHAVLALSPQFSIDSAIVPWERRWRENSLGFHAEWEGRLPIPQTGEAYLVYDPTDIDRKHAALYRQAFAFQAIELPGGGHPITGYLAEVGILQQSILDIARGEFDPAAFRQAASERRLQSAQFFVMQSHKTPTWRKSRRLALMQHAARLAPNNAAVACRLGLELASYGHFEEAFAAHRRALDLHPGQLNLLFNFSLSIELQGDLAAALEMMEEVSARSGAAPIYQPRLHALRALATSGMATPRRRLTRWLRRRLRGPAGM